VCGSLQRRSANRAVLDVARRVGAAEGAVVDDFDGLASLPPFDPDLDADAIAAVAGWHTLVSGADAVLVAAPEYAGAVAGAVKNAFDWLVGLGSLYRKPVAVVSAGTSGGWYARQMMAQTVTWQGGYVVAELGVAAPRTKSDDGGRLTDPATVAAVEAVVVALIQAASLPPEELVARATAVVGALGIDVAHVAPAA
jgi:NAD(P)H-dependent FMN reductase